MFWYDKRPFFVYCGGNCFTSGQIELWKLIEVRKKKVRVEMLGPSLTCLWLVRYYWKPVCPDSSLFLCHQSAEQTGGCRTRSDWFSLEKVLDQAIYGPYGDSGCDSHTMLLSCRISPTWPVVTQQKQKELKIIGELSFSLSKWCWFEKNLSMLMTLKHH